MITRQPSQDLCDDRKLHTFAGGQEGNDYMHSIQPTCTKCGRTPITGYAADPSAPPTTALCHGCFDVLHVGHLRLLMYAKSMADWLIVSIGSDDHVRNAKGPNLPTNSQELRKELLEGLSCVDGVVITDGRGSAATISMIKRIRPDFYVKGREWEGQLELAERAAVEEYGGRVIFMDEFNKAECSSTVLRERLSA